MASNLTDQCLRMLLLIDHATAPSHPDCVADWHCPLTLEGHAGMQCWPLKWMQNYSIVMGDRCGHSTVQTPASSSQKALGSQSIWGGGRLSSYTFPGQPAQPAQFVWYDAGSLVWLSPCREAIVLCVLLFVCFDSFFQVTSAPSELVAAAGLKDVTLITCEYDTSQLGDSCQALIPPDIWPLNAFWHKLLTEFVICHPTAVLVGYTTVHLSSHPLCMCPQIPILSCPPPTGPLTGCPLYNRSLYAPFVAYSVATSVLCYI